MKALVVTAAAAGLAGAAWSRGSRIRKAIADEIEALSAAALAFAPQAIDWSSIDALPAPVSAYLRYAIGENASHVRLAQLRQRGWLRTDGRSRRWMKFHSAQVVVPSACSFIWDATIDVLGPLSVRVIDGLVDEVGAGRVLLPSGLQVDRSVGGLAMNSGALHRYLAEAVWFPTALMPSPQLRWESVDNRRAIATLSTGSTTVSLEFRFGAGAEVTGIYSPGRWGRFGRRFEKVPWEGHFGDYRSVDGLRVPWKGEVGWHLGGRWRAVWKGTLVQALYRR
jgi:hypothetical protein